MERRAFREAALSRDLARAADRLRARVDAALERMRQRIVEEALEHLDAVPSGTSCRGVVELGREPGDHRFGGMKGAIEAAGNSRSFGQLPDGWDADVLPVSFYFKPISR